MLFIVIIASRSVNKNVSTGADVRAKRGTGKQYWRTVKPVGYKFNPTNGWNANRFFRVQILNTPKLNPLNRPKREEHHVHRSLYHIVFYKL